MGDVRIDPVSATAMAGRGVYNANSQIQADAAARGIEFLVRAAGRLLVGQDPIVIADYGSAEGRNSLRPMAAAIQEIRRHGDDPITVVHLDRPENDFSTLFGMIRNDPASYLSGQQQVFALASGGSIFGPLRPPGSVALGWCSIALHWLETWPPGVPPTLLPSLLQGAQREPFTAQAAAEWASFVRSRAAELRRDGSLVVVVPIADDDMTIGHRARLFACIGAALDHLVREGRLRTDERRRMSVPNVHRTRAEIEAAFDDPACGLQLEEIVCADTPDSYWIAFERDRDTLKRAQGYAGFARAAFVPTLLQGLDKDRPANERASLAEDLILAIEAQVARTSGPLYPPRIATLLMMKRR